jgi:hypothetical protein
MNVVIDCASGITALVSAPSVVLAQRDWDEAVEQGRAEPGDARRPRRGEARSIAAGRVHDYR